jgi:hypothetical protein
LIWTSRESSSTTTICKGGSKRQTGALGRRLNSCHIKIRLLGLEISRAWQCSRTRLKNSPSSRQSRQALRFQKSLSSLPLPEVLWKVFWAISKATPSLKKSTTELWIHATKMALKIDLPSNWQQMKRS